MTLTLGESLIFSHKEVDIMRIKEIITETGLTDRAIRLYIDSGLITPKHTESYTGRRSYDFSEEDIARLKNIAVMRKAGFSIEAIGKLYIDTETSRSVLEEFLKQKKEEKELAEDVLERLTPFLEENAEITVEKICDRLTAYNEIPLPEEDRKPTPSEFTAKVLRSATAFSAIGACLFLLGGILKARSGYEHPTVYSDAYVHYIKLMLIPIMLLIGAFELRRLSFRYYEKVTAKAFVKKAVALVIVWVVFTFSAYIGNFPFTQLFPEYYSETDSLDNYLEVDGFVEFYCGDIYELFPATVADSAMLNGAEGPEGYKDTAKYFYRYRDDLGDDFDIYAEWQLPEGEPYTENMEAEIASAKKKFPELTLYEEKKGDWVLTYYVDDDNDTGSDYFYRIFAYNNKTNTVRYIISFSENKPGGYVPEPYFLGLEW